MSQFIKQLPHVPGEPLRIEREFTFSNEVIIIEGVRYDADYFRVFAHPETEYLYAVTRGEDDVVKLTVIHNRVEAAKFFDETFGADPAFTWQQVKERYQPDSDPLRPGGHLPQMGEHHLEEKEQFEGDNDGL